MSWISKLTGVHVSPHGVSLSRPDPIGTVKDIAHDPLPLLGLALPGVGSALGGVLGSIPGVGAAATALSSIPGLGALESGVGNLAKEAGGFLAGNGGKTAIGAAQALSGILDQKKSENYGKDALGAATGAYAAGAPLREQGLAGLQHPTGTGNATSLDAIANQLKTSAPTPVQAGTFTPPKRPTPLSAIGKDAGNPYAV